MRLIMTILLLAVSFQAWGSPSTIYKYRIYCLTEAKNVYVWNDTPPTACPNNNTHAINTNSISTVDQVASNAVKIQAESVPTGGFFRSETFKIVAAPSSTTISHISWPFNISLLMVSCTTTADNVGDSITAEIPSNLTIGAITQDVTTGDTTINVSASVANTVAIGFYISVFDGNQTNALGRVLAIDKINNTLTIETPATNDFAASSPTYITMTVCPIHDFEFGPPQTYNLGQSSLGASHIPANLPIAIKYTNLGPTVKNLVFNYEYLY